MSNPNPLPSVTAAINVPSAEESSQEESASNTSASIQTSSVSNSSTNVLSIGGVHYKPVTDVGEHCQTLMKKKMSADGRKKEQTEWVKKVNISHVLLSPDKKQIVSIGGILVNDLYLTTLTIFARQIGLVLRNGSSRRKQSIIDSIHSYIVSQEYRASIGANTPDINKVLSNKKTRPKYLTQEGSLYRLCNVFTHPKGRELFLLTKKQISRNNLDTKNNHGSVWEAIANLYHNQDGIGEVHDPKHKLQGFELCPNEAEFYDKLDGVPQVRGLADYLLAHYKDARNNKTKSGNHKEFCSFVQGKGWLLYFHNHLMELGDKALMNSSRQSLSSIPSKLPS